MINLRNSLLRTASTMSIFSSLAPLMSKAQDFLSPIVVTATRSEDDKIPYAIEKISQQLMRDQARRTIPEALQFTPGVLVQKTTHGHGSPFIRGFTGRQNLLLIDGVRTNNSTWRSGPVQYWNTVDPFSIEGLELIKSQGSVIFGSDAIGGTLNAVTRSSNFMDLPQGQLFAHGNAFYEYRTNGEGSHVGRLETSVGVGGEYGLHVGVTEKDFGDIEDSAVGRMRGTGYEDRALDLRFDMKLGQDTLLTVASQYVDQDDVSRWHRTRNNLGWKHDEHLAAPGAWLTNLYDQERSLTYARIQQENAEQNALLSKWTLTFSYQKSHDSELQDRRSNLADAYTSSAFLQTQYAIVDTYGIDLSLESKLGMGELVYGMDYYHDEVDSEARRKTSNAGALDFRPSSRPVADDATYDLLGAYANYTIKPVNRVQVSAGTRFTYAEAEWGKYRPTSASLADIPGSNSWTDFSSSLRASVDIMDDWIAYVSASQSFRSPNLADLTGSGTTSSGLSTSGSPDIDPEKFITYEIGTRGRITDQMQIQAAMFHTSSTDGAISSYNVGPDTFTVNGDESNIYGVEAEVFYEFDDHWTARGFVTWQEGKNDVINRTPPGERWIDRMMPFSGSVALRYTSNESKWWVEGRLTGAVDADRIHPANQVIDNQRIPTNGTPGYLVPAIYAGYRVTENLGLNLALENLTDNDYRIHGSGQNEPGFQAIFGIKATW